MIFAKSLKPFNFFLCLLAGVLTFANKAHAQENSTYTPPSMFEDLTPPMIRPETKTGNIVEPKISAAPKIELPKAPRIMPPKTSTLQGVQSPKPPMKPVIEPKIVAPDYPNPPQKVQTQPQGDNSTKNKSAITGPQTMPALPTQEVDKQVTFNGDKQDKALKEPTIFERQQILVQEKIAKEKQEQEKLEAKKIEAAMPDRLTPVVARPKNTSNPTNFDKNDNGALKKIIPFEPGQIALTDEQTNSLAAGVVLELEREEKKNWRVQIKSFATPHGTGISSDRRISLSRALSLRSSLITQGVPADKIDVLAEGLPTGAATPEDKIDLYLYAPASK